MPRHDVLSKVPAAQLAAANDYIVGLFGDDPGTQEIVPNAYQAGQDSHTATHSVACSNCSQADTDALVNYLTVTPGCAGATYPAGSGTDYWAEALRLWSLKPVVPAIP